MGRGIMENVLLYGLAPKMTKEQEDLVDAIMDDKINIVFSNSKAGTGKTTIAVAAARFLVETKKVDSLLYVFNPVEEDKMGYRPGTQTDKEKDYTVPLRQALVEIGCQPEKCMVSLEDTLGLKMRGEKTWVEAGSHTFARGTNQSKKVIIIDEAQNWTTSQLRKMLTRCHDSCKVIVIGHSGQVDLSDPTESGFTDYIDHFKDQPYSATVNLTYNFRGRLAQHADSIGEPTQAPKPTATRLVYQTKALQNV